MARTKDFCEINVVCHPHPEGVYRRLFRAVERKPAKFFGEQHAAISPISSSRNGVFVGVLAVWTQVDNDSDVIDLKSFEEISFNESDVVIPPSLGLNSKVFQFSFNENTHRLFVELRNEQGKTMSSRRIEVAISKVFYTHFHELEGIDEVNVTVVPQRETIEQALG